MKKKKLHFYSHSFQEGLLDQAEKQLDQLERLTQVKDSGYPAGLITGYPAGRITRYLAGKINSGKGLTKTRVVPDTDLAGYPAGLITGYPAGLITGYPACLITGYPAGRITRYPAK